MYTIKNITELLDWSPRQIYERINHIKDYDDSYTERGKKNRILITEEGYTILKRLKELEEDHLSIKQAVKKIENERNNTVQKRETEDDVSMTLRVKQELNKVRMEELKNQLKQKDKLIYWLIERYDELAEKVIQEGNSKKSEKLIEYPT